MKNLLRKFSSSVSPSFRKPQRGIRLLNLPPELIFLILDYLDIGSIISFALTSRYASSLANLPSLRLLFASINPGDLRNSTPEYTDDTTHTVMVNSSVRYLRLHCHRTRRLYNQTRGWDVALESRAHDVTRRFKQVQELVLTDAALFASWKSLDLVCSSVGQETLKLLEVTLLCDVEDEWLGFAPVYPRVCALRLTLDGSPDESYLAHILPNIRIRFPNLVHLFIRFDGAPFSIEFSIFRALYKDAGPDAANIIFPNLESFHITVVKYPLWSYCLAEPQLHGHIRFVSNHPKLKVFALPSSHINNHGGPYQDYERGCPPLDYEVILTQLRYLKAGAFFVLLLAPFSFTSPSNETTGHDATQSFISTVTEMHMDGAAESSDFSSYPFAVTTNLSPSVPSDTPSPWSPWRSVTILTLSHSDGCGTYQDEYTRIPLYFPVLEEFTIDFVRVHTSEVPKLLTIWKRERNQFATRLSKLRRVSIKTATESIANNPIQVKTKWTRYRIERRGAKIVFRKDTARVSEENMWEKYVGSKWGCKNSC